MRSVISFVTVIIIITMTSFTANAGLTITSSGFTNNGMIPAKYTCEGADINPPLHIANIPPSAKSLAIIVIDPDAPMKGGFIHWVMWNVGTNGNIPENFKGASKGLNSAGQKGYKGMCPPSGTHHYHFKVYALDTKLQLDDNTDKAGLDKAMLGHLVAEGDLTGLYQKTK